MIDRRKLWSHISSKRRSFEIGGLPLGLGRDGAGPFQGPVASRAKGLGTRTSQAPGTVKNLLQESEGQSTNTLESVITLTLDILLNKYLVTPAYKYSYTPQDYHFIHSGADLEANPHNVCHRKRRR